MKKIILLFVFSISMLVEAQVTDGLIGHWPLDNNANDVVGTNNGTSFGVQSTADRDGNANSAYEFDANRYIQLGDPATFDFGSNPFTISAWVNRTETAFNYENVVMSKWNTGALPGTNEWLLALSPDTSGDNPVFGIEIGTSKHLVVSTVELNLNEWYHITAIRRTTTIEIYVNGVLTGIKTIPNLPVNNVGRDLQIARFGTNFYLEGGKLDEIKIFDRDLSQSEILQLYNGINATTLCTDLYCVGGNIGIGTDNTNGYKLAVKGKIIAEELKVQVYPWSDFVFEDDYNLPTLAEVAQHIKEKGHLQDIPSAKVVKKNGISIGQMNAKLLQKIEELTLYAIQQEKKLRLQQTENKKLKARLDKIEQLITKVKK